jgi:hypothetical protein
VANHDVDRMAPGDRAACGVDRTRPHRRVPPRRAGRRRSRGARAADRLTPRQWAQTRGRMGRRRTPTKRSTSLGRSKRPSRRLPQPRPPRRPRRDRRLLRLGGRLRHPRMPTARAHRAPLGTRARARGHHLPHMALFTRTGSQECRRPPRGTNPTR